MDDDAALFWFQEGFHAGALAERGRLRESELARRQGAVNRDIQQIVGILAVALLATSRNTASAAAQRRENAKRGARER
jgi:hypothetical protein